jgi:endonuclease/exonuclease/phosphatase family metal-dependent hydrolase
VVLSGSRLRVGPTQTLLLNPGAGRWDWLARRGPQQRFCQRLEYTTNKGRSIVVVHLHASHDPARSPAEIDRAAEFAGNEERTILFGDFNAHEHPVPGYSAPIPGVDQILVRGLAPVSGPAAWPKERRTVGGSVLSDHAPVEAVVE